MFLEPFRVFSHSFRLFFRYAGRRMFVQLLLALVLTYLEGFGIALFLPLFEKSPQTATDSISRLIVHAFAFLHIPLRPAVTLPLLLAAFILKGVLYFFSLLYETRSCAMLSRRLRDRMIDALNRSDYLWLSRSSSGQQTNLLLVQIPRFVSAFMWFNRSMSPAINVAVFLAIVFVLDAKLTLVCVLMGLVAVIIVRYTGSVAARASHVNATQAGILANLLVQMVQAAKYLRATGTLAPFRKRIDATTDRFVQSDVHSGAANALVSSTSQPVMITFLVAILYYRAVVRGEDIAALFVLLGYCIRISGELTLLQVQWQSFIAMNPSVDIVEEAFRDSERHAEERGPQPFTGLQRALSCEELCFGYTSERTVINGISLSIPKNSTVAFVGESGSGKSTLVDLLLGTLKPTSGRVMVDGVDVRTLDIEQLRKRVGYVPQDAVVFEDTVANNISLWRDLPEAQVREAARRAKSLEFIEAMPHGMQEDIGERGIKLSGGQRQRLAIARELCKQPELLVLDEATSALDSESELAIQQSIEELRGQMTILIIAHRLSTIRSADWIYVLREGRVIEEGSYAELLARPGSVFQRMCQLQNVGEVSVAGGQPSSRR